MEPEAAGRFRGTVELAGAGFDLIAALVHEFHRAVSDIPFDRLGHVPALGDGSRPLRSVHDRITDGVYTAVRAVGVALFGVAGALLRAREKRPPLRQEPPRESPGRDAALSALNGFVGDHLAARRNPLAVRPGFYHRGKPLPLTREAFAEAHPRPSGRTVIFLHGLCCNESAWDFYRQAEDPSSTPYGERLSAEHGYSPFYVRYNSGFHVSQSGRTVARLIRRLAAVHPVPVKEIVLIGHSMGGLVARAACHAGSLRGDAWVRRVSNVICLGSPHLGAPLEKAVHLGAMVMSLFDLSRPFARVLESRSLGIKDLRFGHVADADWRGRDSTAVLAGFRTAIPRLPETRYHFIGSSLGRSSTDPMSLLLGDGLVRVPSSTARELADADTAVVFRRHHLRLLNDPEVYAEIVRRVASR